MSVHDGRRGAIPPAAAPAGLPRVIAFLLPQFHPIPENDRWWGRGFTEWTNVTKATPRFPGHYQPHRPADLGYYDLRLPDVRAAQAELARTYGVHGFCYFHYWFNGTRLLERPLAEVVASGEPDFPFCVCWANESWNRRWDGAEHEVLIQQRYTPEDDRRHFEALAPTLADSRYIRVDGRPLLLVYRASLLPNPRATSDAWRARAVRLGLPEPFLCRVESGAGELTDPAALGFDAAVEFQPRWSELGPELRDGRARRLLSRLGVARRRYPADAHVYDYATVAARMMALPEPEFLRFPGVTPSWDNTARRQHGPHILHGSTPALYQRWLAHALARVRPRDAERRIAFVNAWNEWAEGNHLEPDERFGHGYLEATRDALLEFARGDEPATHVAKRERVERVRELVPVIERPSGRGPSPQGHLRREDERERRHRTDLQRLDDDRDADGGVV